MPAMKIALNAHLLSGQAGYRSAGIHSYIANLLRHMPGQAPSDWHFHAMAGASATVGFDGVAMLRSRFDTSSAWRRILWEQTIQALRLSGFDVYHAMAFVAPVYLRAPMVVTVYDLSFLLFPERLRAARTWYLRYFTALTCRRALRVIAISHSTAADLTRLLGVPAEKIDVTPLAYDACRFRPMEASAIERFRAREGLPIRFWLFIGTLEPRKNLTMLLRAYASLPRCERLPLVLGGGRGWMAEEVFAVIEEEGLSGDVRHAGFVSAEDLPLWYNSAEAFVYPSLYEGFGLPVLEAMACGTPAVVSDVSSLPEVLGEAGMRLAPEDIGAWAGALKRVKWDGEWRRRAREMGLERAREFTWRRTARLTLESYRKAAEAGGVAAGSDEPEMSRAGLDERAMRYSLSSLEVD